MASAAPSTICDLPNEVLVAIFSSLPVPDLARCAGTCKRWHEIVTGFSSLWKGKQYSSHRSPMECTETHAVLCALPPFEELIIKSDNGFRMRISYPRLVLSKRYGGIMKDFPRVRCEHLSTKLNIAGDILFYGSTIDFERLQSLQILSTPVNDVQVPDIHNASYVVRTALSLCPSLRHLSIGPSCVSAEYLYTVEELGQFQSLEIECVSFDKLSFLRHCSGALEHLQLVNCDCLPPGELAELRQLKNLRRLLLSCWDFREEDLVAAVAGLHKLESLDLEKCGCIGDLSFLQHCGHLRELTITHLELPLLCYGEMSLKERPGEMSLKERPVQFRPYTEEDRTLFVNYVVVTADDLPAALTRLKELGITGSCHSYLAALHPCSQLRHLCIDFVCEQYDSLSVRVMINLSN